jgi:hypothetical protein
MGVCRCGDVGLELVMTGGRGQELKHNDGKMIVEEHEEVTRKLLLSVVHGSHGGCPL